MDYSRREFMGLAAATVVGSTVSASDVAGQTAGNDLLRRRADFPVLRDWTYLNSAYIAPSPQPVIDATVAFHQAKASDPISLGAMLDETRILRERFAQLVNASPGEVGLLSATSEGENVVTAALDLEPGDNVVIDDLHYDTTELLYQHLVESRGIELRIVDSVGGAAPPELFARYVDGRTRVVSVSWVSHQNGYRHDLDALADLAHSHDAYLYVDAIQGVGAVELDVAATPVDFFTCGGYKWLLAGFGVAPFYVREALLGSIGMDRVGWRQLESEPEPRQYQFYEDARKYGYATPAFGAVYQMRAALDYVLGIGVERIEAHTSRLAVELNHELRGLGFDVLTPAGNASPIVAFKHGVAAEEATRRLQDARVRVSLRENGTQVRVGIALFNNRDDVDKMLEACESLRT